MKIAILLFFRAPLGGLQENVRSTVIGMAGRGHEVHVYCPPGPWSEQLATLGIVVFDVSKGFCHGTRYDLVHAHPGQGRILGRKIAKEQNIPFFITLHGAWIDGVQTYWRFCQKIFVVSPAIEKLVIEKSPEAAGSIELMPNTASSDILITSFPKNNKEEKFYINVASRFDVDKERVVKFLIDLWVQQKKKSAAHIHWDIAGDGTLMEILKNAADEIFGMSGQVNFYGWLGADALNSLLSRASVSISPGRSAIDAMARGIPVVALGSQGCFGLVTKDSLDDAFYCNYGGYGLQEKNIHSPEKVMEDLIDICNKQEALYALGVLSRDFVNKNLNEKYWLDKLEGFYTSAVLEK